MTEFIWQWTKGNRKIFTRNTKLAEQAMQEGILVIGKKMNPHIIKY